MYQLAITRDFIAQHYLIGGDWGSENQKHSHHYRVEVLIESETLDRHGYLVDIVDLENSLNMTIDGFRDHTLNDLPHFKDQNPSLERFARVIWQQLDDRLELDAACLSVKVWENESDWAAYRSDGVPPR